jgi:RraA family protein
MSISGQPGFRLRRAIDRADAKVVTALAKYPVAIVGDALGRRGVMHQAIKPLVPEWKLAGPAVTVEVRPGDNLMIHTGLALAQPGDVLVIDAKGNLDCGLWGGILHALAARRQIAGVVIDGAVRDLAELRASPIPVFARGVNPCGGDKEGPGQVNFPISCGGVPVMPGDVVLGDGDGVLVVPSELSAQAPALAQGRIDAEGKWLAAIDGGVDVLPFVVPNLRRYGVLREDEDLIAPTS